VSAISRIAASSLVTKTVVLPGDARVKSASNSGVNPDGTLDKVSPDWADIMRFKSAMVAVLL